MPGLDVAIIVESNSKTSEKTWEVTSEFVANLIKKIPKTLSSINTGLVIFNKTGQYPIVNVSHSPGQRAKKILIEQFQTISQKYQKTYDANSVDGLEFAFNRFLTEEHGSFSQHKMLVALTRDRVTDDHFADIRRKYPEERVLFLNVVMKYNQQNLGVTDFGIEESLKSVYSLSELTELVRRIKDETGRLIYGDDSCFKRDFVTAPAA